MKWTIDWSKGLVVLCQFYTVLSHTSHQHGHTPGERPTGLHDPKVVHDTEHIKEHYEGTANLNESEMTAEEMEFHYFKLHDFDNNTMLDGLEILKALTHLLPYEEPENDKVDITGKTPDQVRQARKDAELRYYTEIVDSVLEEDDIDQNGYLTYPEYVLARRREEARERVERARNKREP